MWFNKLIISLLVIDVTLFTIVTSFHIGDELIMAPANNLEIGNKQHWTHQRIRRQVYGIADRRFYRPASIQPRDPTVIVVPNRASNQYRGIPASPYGVNGQNRGTTVVISQVPDYNYNYNNVVRSYEVLQTPF